VKLTPLGAKAAQLGPAERKQLATKIIKGENVDKYTSGVCYEAAAFVRFLATDKIKPDDLISVAGDVWLQRLGFVGAPVWDGKSGFKTGAAIGFFRVPDKKLFHVGIATGSSTIRAVNGHALGNGWQEVDLRKVLKNVDPAEKTFEYDRARIKVLIGKT
jgi:hypothetical protein